MVWRMLGLALGLVLVAAAAAGPLRAQVLLRDADIEHALREVARPVLAAAGFGPDQIRILVIEDRRLNAFVGDAQHVFVSSGLMLRMKDAPELQAVLAHEIAHIANGHITRRAANARSARSAAGMGILLALAAAGAGAGEAAAGVALGAAGSAQRLFFAHTRAEEAAADQSGVRYLAAAGIDPGAMVRVLELFRGQEALNIGRQDPYAVTHPLSRDRIRALEGHAAAWGGAAREDPAAAYWFARAQGKLGAWLQNPAQTLRAVGREGGGDVATLRRAVALHRQPKPAEAIAEAQRLAAARPDDPFLRDLLCQILLESRRPAEAVATCRDAVRMSPRHPLLLAGLGRALVAEGSARALGEAIEVLEAARSRDPADPAMLRDLARAYAGTGQPGMASVATAERYALLGRFEDAALHARRAQDQLPRGGPGWLRAEDVLRAAEAASARARRRGG